MGLMQTLGRKSPSFRNYALASTIALSSFLGCSGSSTTEPEPNDIVLGEKTKILNESTMNSLSSYRDGKLTFRESNDQLKGISLGDILIGGSSSLFPSGFIRKVDYVSQRGDTIKTSFASIEEGFEKLSGNISMSLSPSGISHMSGLDGVGKPVSNESYRFSIPLNDVVLYDRDNNHNTKNDQITANGELSFNCTIDFGFDISHFKVKEVSLTNTVEGVLDLDVGSSISLDVDKEVTLATYRLGAVPIPPTPFFVDLILEPHVGIEGSAQTGLSTNISQSAQFTTGINYKDKTWSKFSDFSNEFDFSVPQISADASLKGYVGVDVGLELCSVVGPSAEFNAFLKLDADLMRDPFWTLKGGFESFIGVEADILGFSLFDYNVKIIDKEEVLLQAQSRPLNASLVATPSRGVSPLEVLLDASSSTGSITSYQFIFGDPSANYTESFNNAPDGIFDGKVKHVYSKGNFSPSVIVKNNVGKADTANANIVVEEVVPTTKIIQPGSEGKDAFVGRTLWPDASETFYAYGDSTILNVHRWYGSSHGGETMGLIEFPLSDIPSNAQVKSAKLKFYGYMTSNIVSNTPTLQVSKLNGSWQESSVNWNNKPTRETIRSVDIIHEGNPNWYEVDVTSYIQEGVNGNSYHGFGFSTNENDVGGVIWSGDNPDVSKRPILEVSYTK